MTIRNEIPLSVSGEYTDRELPIPVVALSGLLSQSGPKYLTQNALISAIPRTEVIKHLQVHPLLENYKTNRGENLSHTSADRQSIQQWGREGDRR